MFEPAVILLSVFKKKSLSESSIVVMVSDPNVNAKCGALLCLRD